ncbi:aspartyl protease AED3-like [Dioscorea cayenensis subsp. rotundata]|uniref:Aspartyl protease AED3-like n=1 Tax=Dioscorea cayennensis subsp. rotundata TaxID=55577 RepID=A0AB40C9V3_DIOCR|nr:aspartyl protease AED3-like [Dioscorea cayenensis subsp. rotundata]
MAMPLMLLPLAACLLSHALASSANKVQGSDLSVTLRSNVNYAASWEDIILDLASRDESRFLHLASLVTTKKTTVPIGSGQQLLATASTYIVRAAFGTPPQPMLVAMDTSNDAAWIPCSPCVGCPSTTNFIPSMSSSYQPIPCGAPQCSPLPNPSCSPAPGSSCGFNLTYGSSSIDALLSKDSLSLAADSIPSYIFGCLRKVTGSSIPPQGLIGLGRGPLSLLSQTRSLYASTFSYCLPSFRSLNFSGSLRLGPVGQPKRIKTTPLLASPRRSSIYFVNMTGIRVGRTSVAVPPGTLVFDQATGAGTIFDSGTMFTRLVAPLYTAVRDTFRRRVKGTVSSLGGFDTCYEGTVSLPTITLEFTGMNVTLPVENVMIHSAARNLSCLAMAAAPDNVNAVLNVIASMQQQNHRVLFDVPGSRLGVAREPCTTA